MGSLGAIGGYDPALESLPARNRPSHCLLRTEIIFSRSFRGKKLPSDSLVCAVFLIQLSQIIRQNQARCLEGGGGKNQPRPCLTQAFTFRRVGLAPLHTAALW